MQPRIVKEDDKPIVDPVPAAPAVLSDEDAVRAGTYGLLGRLLSGPPDEGLLALLQQAGEEGAQAREGIVYAWSVLRLAAQRAEPGPLREEYQELFIGMPQGELVPYASWYLTGSILERPLIVLRQDLERLGFERQEGVHEPEDHAGALCETMALLIGDTAVAFEEQQRFFERHLEPWIGRFFSDLQRAKFANFYRSVGVLGEEFLRLERRYLTMLA
jgi:TorA maturation chaperone TorD